MGRAHSLGYAVAPLLQDLDIFARRDLLIDRDPSAAASAAERLGWARSGSDWRSAVADPDIDIIDIVTPPDLHEEIAVEALRNGKHVFCEKPITNDPVSALRMAEAAEKTNAVTQVGFNYRHISALSAIKGLVEEGQLGHPLQFRGTYQQDPLFFIDDFGWRGSRSTGGSGATGDIGSHIIDIAQYLCGQIVRVSAIQRVKSKLDRSHGWMAQADPDLLDEAATWLAEFESGAIGTFSAGFLSYGHKNHLTFSLDSTGGSVMYDWNQPAQFEVALASEPSDSSGFKTVLVSAEHPDVWYPVAGLGQGYIDGTALQIRHFLEAIAGKRQASPSFRDAAQVQAVVQAITTSAQDGTWTDVESL